jgi:23S rRNA (cytidine1920-2'-O)/16S rRNA (cytidine1409-2'-O)-methyltransferase
MKRRLDQLLVERGLAESRARAQALVLAGKVYCGETKLEKAGTKLSEDTPLEVRGVDPYVSRGGHKLAGALLDLGLSVRGQVCVDIGASTGGFTDCALQNGASKVYAVDVGQGQLAARLAQDDRVVVRDKTNARHLDATSFPEAIDVVLVDASFIGLEKLLPAIASILPPGGGLLALIKPQFEVGREEASRSKGVIRDPKVRTAAIQSALQSVRQNGFEVVGDAPCRVPGPKGNVEHFVRAVRAPRRAE